MYFFSQQSETLISSVLYACFTLPINMAVLVPLSCMLLLGPSITNRNPWSALNSSTIAGNNDLPSRMMAERMTICITYDNSEFSPSFQQAGPSLPGLDRPCFFFERQ